MEDPESSWSDKWYAALLSLLPLQFRTDFGSDMEEVFREQRVYTEKAGRWALAAMWGATIRDIVRMAPREHLSVLLQDTRFALRMLAKDPGYAFVATAILGLGIGANTAIFSMVNAVLLQPLPYAQGDRLVMLHQRATKVDTNMLFSVKEIGDYRRQAGSLSDVAEFHSMQFTLFNRGQAARVRAGVVSAGFFELFGVKPIMGRTFVASDDNLGAPAVLLVSYEFWKQNQNADPAILGKRFEMNDRVHTVIGVLPPIPQYPSENDVYMPTSACPFRSSAGMIANRNSRMMDVFGRLKPGVTLKQSQAELAGIGRRLEQDYGSSYPKSLGYAIESKELKTEITQRARPMLLVLLGAAAFVLLIACANVANLILARMARRERELMIRTAVGAGGGRLLRQLLTESLIMALLAAGAGLLFATGSLHLLTGFAGQLTPRAREIGLNGWVLGFAVLCATTTSLFFGSIAALTSRTEISAGLKEGRGRLRSALIVAQVAFSVVLLIGATLMVRSLLKLESVNPGFVPRHVFAAGINLNWSKHSTPPAASPNLTAAAGCDPIPTRRAIGGNFIQFSLGPGCGFYGRLDARLQDRGRGAIRLGCAEGRKHARGKPRLFPHARNSAGERAGFHRRR